MIGTSFPYRSGIWSSFIDNVPCIEFYIRIFRCKCFHYNFNIIFQTLIHDFWCHPCTIFIIVLLKEPIWCLTVPYQNMPPHRNVIFCCKFQQLVCTLQRNLRMCLVTILIQIGNTCCLIQNTFWLQFIAKCQAIVMLVDQVLCCLLCQFRLCASTAQLEIITVDIF